MAAATAAHGGHLATRLRPSTRRRPPMPLQVTAKVNFITSTPPIFISTNLAHINPHHLKELYVLCNHSSHRFPNVDSVGRVEPIDFVKLCTAVSHSSVVVSAFTKPEFFTPGSSSGDVVSKFNGIGGDWIRKMTPVTPENGRLIGFGRAVSDCGLTASIYDVMVHPALQGRGIGRMIVQRIIRKLTSIGVYDIAALCSDKERLFFGACGFGDDTLKSKTMMYTRTPISPSIEEQAIVAGRKLLIFPPKR
ncbi:GCN5-related N-acetyltransferase 3, chloroplastic [Primulina eburnea]|uniref:GCN5-related N-acetyltransferase 3, chloroplastic n=1 Tax=Primulina eburnea TaxID=1245227 RepID=UPI003C6C793E